MASHLSAAYLAIPPMPPATSLKSARSSGSSTTSSLSSTFSDLTGNTSSSSSSSPPNAKTNAFFASPFSTRPPSPATTASPPPPSPSAPQRSLTADFFATSVRSPSPPASSSSSSVQTIHSSRIFPSRYTSSASERRSPQFSLLSNLDAEGDAFYSHRTHGRTPSSSSSEGSSSFASSSSFARTRLPTPPPSPLRREDTLVPSITPPPSSITSENNDNEPTPRPADREPSPLLRFERSLLLQRQAQARDPVPMNSLSMEEDSDSELDDEANDPHPGTIISLPIFSQLPLSPLSLTFSIATPTPHTVSSGNEDRGTPTPTNEAPTSASASFSHFSSSQSSSSRSSTPPLRSPVSHTQPALSSLITPPSLTSADSRISTSDQSESHTSPSQLRLLRPLGHGAFSAVWLAEDLSKVPLTIVSRKSVRDLRRMASGKDKDKGRDRSDRAVNKGKRKANGDDQSLHVEGVEGGVDDVTEHTAGSTSASPASETKSNRQPSRLRGLRNMLSFSRQSPTTSMPTPVSPITRDNPHSPPTHDANTPFSLSRASSTGSDISTRSSAGPSRNVISNWRFSQSQAHAQAFDGLDQYSLSRDASLRKFRARVRGTRPPVSLGRSYLDERDGEMGEPRRSDEHHQSTLMVNRDMHSRYGGSEDEGGSEAGLGASLSRNGSLSSSGRTGGSSSYGRLVAVKMTPRRPPRAKGEPVAGVGINGRQARRRDRQSRKEEEERTRVGFVREVEVLKHISHPNITPLLAHLSSSTHHILVLPYLPGGDLLGLVNSDVAWGKLAEPVLRRIWYELCKAVGWMHGVGLVHRDIKLENILLTAPTFSSLTPTSPIPKLDNLPLPPSPFIKLSDFGLSRFVEIDANGEAELLSTRCGSEAYAAPELVTGGGGAGRGVYDARKTDAWACGVVLYALVGRQLPFGEGVTSAGGGSKIGGERGVVAGVPGTAAERRTWLMRIARGEWEWPGDADDKQETLPQPSIQQDEELVGPHLVKSHGARRLVDRLLVRDPRKRARIGDLWDDAWMCGGDDEVYWRARENEGPVEGIPLPSTVLGEETDGIVQMHRHDIEEDNNPCPPDLVDSGADVDMQFYGEPTGLEPFGMEGDGVASDEEEEDGCLFDHEGIDNITRQEVV